MLSRILLVKCVREWWVGVFLFCRSLSLSNVYCESTGSRYSISAHNDRVCIENSMKNYCPVCYEVCGSTAICHNWLLFTGFHQPKILFYANIIFLTGLKAEQLWNVDAQCIQIALKKWLIKTSKLQINCQILWKSLTHQSWL